MSICRLPFVQDDGGPALWELEGRAAVYLREMFPAILTWAKLSPPTPAFYLVGAALLFLRRVQKVRNHIEAVKVSHPENQQR